MCSTCDSSRYTLVEINSKSKLVKHLNGSLTICCDTDRTNYWIETIEDGSQLKLYCCPTCQRKLYK